MVCCECLTRCKPLSSSSICLSQCNSDLMLGWDAGIVPFFFVKKYWYTGNNKASLTSTGSFGVNNQTKVCGGPLSFHWWESTRNHNELQIMLVQYKCWIILVFKVIYTLLCFTMPKPGSPALCKLQGLIAFKLDRVILFSINMFILFKNADFSHEKGRKRKKYFYQYGVIR